MNWRAPTHGQMKLTQLAAMIALALTAMADVQAQPDAADAAEATMPRIEVTGRKDDGASYTASAARTATPLSMSLRDTPQSVSVVTQQRIEDLNLKTVTDVVNNVIGVSVNQYETSRAGFTARGFDIDNLQIDGVPTSWEQSWSSGEVTGSLAIYDRVEVVRGATGLMTGAGNPSAAINLVRKRATSKELTGSAEVELGSRDQRRVMVDVSTPLNKEGSVRARVVGEYEKSGSFVELASDKSKTAYAIVEADLTPHTVLSAGIGRQETDPKGPMWGGLPYWYTDGSKTNWSTSKTTAADWATWPTEYNNGFVDLEHRFDNGWKVRASYARGDRKSDSYLLYLSGIPDRATGVGMSAFSGSYKTHTKKDDVGLYASGPFELGGRKHEAAFGYMHMKQDFNSDSRTADFGNQSSEVGDFNNWNGANYPTPSWSALSFYDGSVTKQDALYGMARFSLTDPLKLIVGARVTNYEKTGLGLYTAAYSIKQDKEVTPYAGLVYDIDKNHSAYVSYTSIFQPQNLKDVNGDLLDPIVGKSYEAGVKGEYLDGRLTTSFAVFQIKQDKLGQETGMIDRDGDGALAPEAYYRASEGAKSTGFEFEVNGELARGWNATAGYSQFRAKDAGGVDVNSVYPRRLLRVFTTYRLPNEWSALTIGGGVNWEGRTYTVDSAAPVGSNGLIEQDSFSLVKLMARYEINKNLTAQLNVDNALDKTHFGMFAAYGALTYAAPRTVSASLKYRF